MDNGPTSADGATPRAAAAIILLRDGAAGMEVLILQKAAGNHFAAGALVFPGGSLEPEDHHFALQRDQASDPLLAFKVAAIREMYEECGILLARRPGRDQLLGDKEAESLHKRSSAALTLAHTEPLELAIDQLVCFAHWITPPIRPKRFDTRFFIAAAPTDQGTPRLDGYEIVDARWRRPPDLLAEAEAGTVKLVLPTLMNVTKLARWQRVDDALAATRDSTIACVVPERVETEAGVFHRIPAEADYGATMISVERFRLA